MKKAIFLMFFLLMASATAQVMCSDTPLPNQECRLVTPSLSCPTYNYTLINASNGVELSASNLINLNTSIYYAVFNETAGYYIVKLCDSTTRELFVQPAQEGKMFFLMGIILLPLLIGFLLLYGASNLSENHGILKSFMFILAIMMPIISFQYGIQTAAAEDPTLSSLIASLNTHATIFSWVYYLIIIYFIILWVKEIFEYIAEKREEKKNY